MRATNLIIAALVAVVVLGGGGAAYLYLTTPAAQPTPPLAEAPMRPSLASNDTSAQASSEPEQPEAPEAKVSTVRGTAEADTLAGTAEADRIYAAEDADPQGKDSVDGGAGDDRIYVDSTDTVQGGPGHDELIVRGAKGYTLKLAASGIEETWGGDGNDDFDGIDVLEPLTLRGGLGNDRLRGGNSADVLFGGDGDDRLDGSPGDDTLKGEAGTDILTGGSGADLFNYAKFDGSTDVITDYSSEAGDTVTAASFKVSGTDTMLLDEDGNTLFVLKNYDAGKSGVSRRR